MLGTVLDDGVKRPDMALPSYCLCCSRRIRQQRNNLTINVCVQTVSAMKHYMCYNIIRTKKREI